MENWIKELAEQYVRTLLSEMPAHENTKPPDLLTPSDIQKAVGTMSSDELKRAAIQGQFHEIHGTGVTEIHPHVRTNIIELGKAARIHMRALKASNIPPAETPVVDSSNTPPAETPVVDSSNTPPAETPSVSQETPNILDMDFETPVRPFSSGEKDRRARVGQAQEKRLAAAASRRVNENWMKEIRNAYSQILLGENFRPPLR